MALESEEATRKIVKVEKQAWYKSISENEEVLSAVLVCTVMSLILIVLIVTGNSALYIYDKRSSLERKIAQKKREMQIAKREHKKAWNNPQMYLRHGTLGPHYLLQKFKATDALDTADLKLLKITGTVKYKDKELQVVVEYVDKIIIKKPQYGNVPDEVWLRASGGMYLLKQKYASEEYKEEFDALLQRYTREY